MTNEEEWELLQRWEKMDDNQAYWDFQREKAKAFYKWVKENKNPLEFKFMGKEWNQ